MKKDLAYEKNKQILEMKARISNKTVNKLFA